jgi:hypothetical protein
MLCNTPQSAIAVFAVDAGAAVAAGEKEPLSRRFIQAPITWLRGGGVGMSKGFCRRGALMSIEDHSCGAGT